MNSSDQIAAPKLNGGDNPEEFESEFRFEGGEEAFKLGFRDGRESFPIIGSILVTNSLESLIELLEGCTINNLIRNHYSNIILEPMINY